MKWIVIILVVLIAVLAATNPDEAQFREHIREQEGIAGTLGMAVADLFSGGKKGGSISRENYIVASRFYIGGDGILPRQDLAWGVGGKFFDIEQKGNREPVLPR